MNKEVFVYVATTIWVFTILMLLIYVWKYELTLNLPIVVQIIRNNQVYNLEDEETKENSTSSCYSNKANEEIKIAENV
jgi:hypothetical protein